MTLRFSPARGAGSLSLSAFIRGPQGPAASVDVGGVTTGAPGTDAAVVNSGSSSAAILNFTIPRGDVGAQGPIGNTGLTGDTGPGYKATSTSSQVIGNSGTKTFATQSGLAYAAGARVRAADASNPSVNYMEGVVTSYSGTSLVFTADRSAGSGTLTNWTINLAGDVGAQGPSGTGDFSSNTASSVDGEAVVFSGTGGKTGKRFAATGLVKATSGVLAAAVSNTDYLPVASPTMTGTPAAPTAAADTDTTQLATTAYAMAQDRKTILNTQTASYTLVLADAGKTVEVNNASANTLTIPPNSSVAFPLRTVINAVQYGAGQTTLTAGAGVTLRSRNGLKLAGQYAVSTLYQRATDEWIVGGDLSA